MPIKGAQQVLIETFTADVVIPQYVAVVQGASDYHATLPAAANAGAFLGITLDTVEASGESIPVVMEGTAWVQASGAIAAGDQVIIANALGQIEAVGATATPVIVGTALSTTAAAGDICLIKIA